MVGVGDGGGISNTFSGRAESVVQAGTIRELHVHGPAAPGGCPRQLPPRVAGFVDRTAQLTRLTQLLDARAGDGSTLVVVLSGIGGIGKTALGRQWAHEVGDRFGGGHLYADLGAERHRGGVAVGDVLAGFLRALRVPEEWVPPDVAGRAALFRTRTSEHPTLVLLDDADQPAQVRPLVPASPGSAVVVTSHRRMEELVLDGAVVVTIDPLDAGSGAQLIATMIGHERVVAEPGAAAELVRLCGGLPLALRVAAARLLSNPAWTVARSVRDLRGDGRLERLAVEGRPIVDAAWESAYTGLPPAAARLYRLLALHPGPDFTVPAAGALAGRPPGEVEAALAELRAANFLQEDAHGRFAFHDLVRLHARGRAEADPVEEREAAARRCVAWYLRRAAAADRAVQPRRLRIADHPPEPGDDGPFENAAEAMAWFERERLNLVWCVRAAAERAGDAAWDEAAWQLCEPLWVFFVDRRYYGDWVETHELGVAAAVRRGDLRAESRVRAQLSRALREQRNFAAARTAVDAALAAARAAGDRRLEASALEFTGLVQADEADYPGAVASFEASLAINEDVGNPRGVVLQLYLLGRTLDQAGRHTEAVASLERARHLITDIADVRTTRRIALSLGRAYAHLARYDEAAVSLEAALTAARDAGAQHEEAEALEALAELHAARGDHARARTALSAAAAIYARWGSPRAAELRARRDGG